MRWWRVSVVAEWSKLRLLLSELEPEVQVTRSMLRTSLTDSRYIRYQDKSLLLVGRGDFGLCLVHARLDWKIVVKWEQEWTSRCWSPCQSVEYRKIHTFNFVGSNSDTRWTNSRTGRSIWFWVREPGSFPMQINTLNQTWVERAVAMAQIPSRLEGDTCQGLQDNIVQCTWNLSLRCQLRQWMNINLQGGGIFRWHPSLWASGLTNRKKYFTFTQNVQDNLCWWKQPPPPTFPQRCLGPPDQNPGLWLELFVNGCDQLSELVFFVKKKKNTHNRKDKTNKQV